MEKFYTPLKSLLSLFLILFTFNVNAADYYWIGGSGDVNDLNHWATTSGGSTLHSNLPSENDDLFFDANSFSANDQQVNFNQNISFHDLTADNLGFAIDFVGTGNWNIYGSLYISNQVGLALNAAIYFNFDEAESVFVAQNNFNSNPDAVSITLDGSAELNMNSGLGANVFYHNSGTVNYGANTFNFTYFYALYSSTRTLNISDATINVERWDVNDNADISVISTNSTINVNDEFHGGSKQYDNLIASEPEFFDDVYVTGDNTFSTIQINAGVELKLDAGSTQTVTSSIDANGTETDLAYFISSTEGTTAFLTGSGININGTYVNISDVDYTGSATFSLENSLILDDSQGWETNSVPTPTGSGQFYYSKVFSDSVYLGLTAGDGMERIVFMRAGDFPDVTVADDTEYTANTTFGAGDLVGTDTYVVYQGKENQVKIEGLQPNTEYYITRMEVNSTSDNSSIKYQSTSTSFSKIATTLESGNIYMENGSVEVNSGDSFYDDGGAGYYFPNRSQVLTLNSAEAGKSVKLTFNELEVRSYEKLRIFDGTDTTATLLESFSGSSHTLPFSVTSSGESLTVKFESEDFETSDFSSDGWQADVEILLTEPSLIPSNLSTTDVQDNQISFTFEPGNGSGRLILAFEEQTNFFYNIEDDIEYTANNNFGSGEEVYPGVFVIGNGDIDQLTLTGLTANSTYEIRIIEYNQAAGSINYSSGHYISQISNTYQPPSDHFSNYRIYPDRLPVIQRNVNDLTLSGVNLYLPSVEEKDILNVLLLASENPINEDELSTVLVDDFSINADEDFKLGDEVLPGVFALSKSKFDAAIQVNNLDSDTKYHFAAVLYRENVSGVRYGLNTFTEIVNTSTLQQESIRLGDGQNTISSQKTLYDQSGFSGNLENSFSLVETYIPAESESSLKLIMEYNYLLNVDKLIIYDGTDTNAPVLRDYTNNRTGLFYNQEILEATNETGAITIEFVKSEEGQSNVQDKIGFRASIFQFGEGVKPSVTGRNIQISNISYQSADVNWDRGDGEKVLVIFSSDDRNLLSPIDGLNYLADRELKKEVTRDNYAVYNGTENNFSVSELEPGTTYHVRIFEYNGSSSDLVYGDGISTIFKTKTIKPNLDASNVQFEITGEDEITLNWTSGNGKRRLVLINTGNYANNLDNDLLKSYEFPLVEGGTYSDLPRYRFSNSPFSYLGYNGDGNSVTISGLSKDQIYYFNVVEYNELDGLYDYLIPKKDYEFAVTPSTPTYSFNSFEVFDISATEVKLDAEGQYGLVVISDSDNADVPFEEGKIPDDLEDIRFGREFQGVIDGKIVLIRPLDSITVNVLKPNTDYLIAVYPVNLNEKTVNYSELDKVTDSFQTGPVKDFYYINKTGFWEDEENWVTSSGGTELHHAIPDASSNVIIDENSFIYGDEEYTYIYFRNSEASVYNLDLGGVNENLTLINENYTTLKLNIGSSIYSNEYSKIIAGSYNFIQLADTNYVKIPVNRTVGNIKFRANSGNKTIIQGIPKTSAFDVSNSHVIFALKDDELAVNQIFINNTKVDSLPTFYDVRTINSDLHFDKIITNEASDIFWISSSLHVDSLILKGNSMKFSNSDTLNVSHFQYPTTSFTINSETSKSYIKTDKDSLILENAIISNNHTIGNAFYLANNSIKLDNVKGWNFSLDSVPEFEGNGDLFGRKVLKESLLLISKNKPRFQNYYVTIQTSGDSTITPAVKNIPTVSNTFYENLKKEQGVFVGSTERFDVKGLQPSTDYELKIYDYYEREDSLFYSIPKIFEFSTLDEGDILMNSVNREEKVTKNVLYTENGSGSSYPWNENSITLLPTAPSKKANITVRPGSRLNSPLDINVYDGSDNTAPLIFSENLRDYELLESITINSITASNDEGALTVELKKPDGSFGGYIYDRSTEFLVYESEGVLANEPTQQAKNIVISNTTKTTADISWTRGDGSNTLVFMSKEGYSYDNTTFVDGLKLNESEKFGEGDILGTRTPNKYIMYAGQDSSFTVEGLDPESRYYVHVLTFNFSDSEDPNYLWSDISRNYFTTLPGSPVSVPINFSIVSKQATTVKFTVEDSTGTGALILINEGKNVDLSLVNDSIKNLDRPNHEILFDQLDSLQDGSRIYFANQYHEMVYELNQLKESTKYYYAIYNFRENNTGRTVNENALTGSFSTRDGSFKIDNFALPDQNLEGDQLCQGAVFKIDYSYLGVNQGENFPIPVYSNNPDMRDSLALDVISSENGYLIVQLPDELDSGKYYFSLIPELGSDFNTYVDSLNIVSVSEMEISRNENQLVANSSENLSWFRNDAIIEQQFDSVLDISQEGKYYATKFSANCEYTSNEIYVKAEIALNQDTIQSCTNQLLDISFENAFGKPSSSFNYYALLMDGSGNEQSLELDTINLDNNFFSFALPDNLLSDYYSIVLKTDGDSIESDTAIVYIENLEPAVVTLTENGLSSNYENGNQWLFNGEPINGATSQTISIDRTGVYSVEVSTEFCTIQSEGITLTSNKKGLMAVGFRAYPNPIRNDLNLKYTGDEYLGLSSVVVTDLRGKTVYNGLHDFQRESKLQIPLNEISSGVYFITVETKHFRAQQKLIKR
ncbi:T9SS type A sorting domain-containing protein [Marivirga sp.]|uniref:T9SS type A sorting domain-containing protein n=1 Tax=Marivirga sp. TaxID=2018662 RepID=UPI003DA6FA8F